MRPLDSIEKFFYSVSSLTTSTGITHMMVTVGAQLPLLPGVIDHVSLRYNHPRIACTVKNGKLRYQVPSEEGLQAWVSQTLIIDTSGRSGQEY
jgi:hypothetical protein